MIDGLFSGSLAGIEAALDVRAVRQDLIASNIANAETPGYRALDVDFEATMRALLTRDEQGRLAPSRPLQDALKIVGDDRVSIGNSQNTVDLEAQMAHLEQNALMYRITSQLAAMRFQGLKNVISEGGRQ